MENHAIKIFDIKEMFNLFLFHIMNPGYRKWTQWQDSS